MSRSVTSTLQNFLDLIFRDLIEPALKDLLTPGTSSTIKYKRQYSYGLKIFIMVELTEMISGRHYTNFTVKSAT